jgi:hypothetical protein
MANGPQDPHRAGYESERGRLKARREERGKELILGCVGCVSFVFLSVVAMVTFGFCGLGFLANQQEEREANQAKLNKIGREMEEEVRQHEKRQAEPPPPAPKMRTVPAPITVGKPAKIKPTPGSNEQFVRLLTTRAMYDRWHAAAAKGDQAEQLRVFGDNSNPVFSLDAGATVTVAEVAGDAARVTAAPAGGSDQRSGWIPVANLDAGTEQVEAPAGDAPAAGAGPGDGAKGNK